MSTPARPLRRLQQWMHELVVHPGRIDEAVRSARARAIVRPRRVGEVVRPSRTLDPLARLDIYHGMYPLRMRDALRADYPGLSHFLGQARFDRLVRDYVRAHPSRSYTLNRLGDHLPAYIRAGGGKLKPRAFCHDLARLELAMTEVFDEEETEVLGADEVAGVGEESWEHAVLRPIPAFRLLSLGTNAGDYLSTVREEGHDHPRPSRRVDRVVVYRRRYAVYHLSLPRAAFALLTDVAAGVPLGRALARAMRRRGGPPPGREFFVWFRRWVSEGLFRTVELRAAQG
jgi:hypothetical protein